MCEKYETNRNLESIQWGGWHRLPESERMTSLSSRGSLLSISSSSSSSPSLPSGLQPSAAHSSRSFASVSSAFDEPHRLWAANQSLSTRLWGRGGRYFVLSIWFVDNYSLYGVFRVLFLHKAHLQSGLCRCLGAVWGVAVATVYIVNGTLALLLSCCYVQPRAALLKEKQAMHHINNESCWKILGKSETFQFWHHFSLWWLNIYWTLNIYVCIWHSLYKFI